MNRGAGRWYRDRGIQAAIIGGAFLLLSSLVAAFVALRKPDPLPPLEIKTISGGGKEQVLATLAMHPESQVIDSSDFANLPDEYVLVNDSLGIALKKPTEYRWSAGRLSRLGGVDWYDIPVLKALGEEVGKMWGIDTGFVLPFYGVRLDQPFRIRLSGQTKVAGVPLGANFLDDPEVAKTFTDYNFTEDPDANWFDRQKYREEIRHSVDSVNKSKLPTSVEVYSGVFISPITNKILPARAGIVWNYLSLFEKTALMLSQRLPPNNLLYIDRERHVIIFNESVKVEAAEVDDVLRGLILNRVGYAILIGKAVYLVQLQFLSGQDERTLDELKEYFRSVRLRAEPKGHP